VVLEAWAAHKPVVVSQVGGPNEYVQHEVTGLKIFPRPDSVAWGLGTLLADSGRAKWMGENGRRAMEDSFTWGAIAPQTMTVYDPAYPPRTSTAPTPTVAALATSTNPCTAELLSKVPAQTTPVEEMLLPVPTEDELEPVAARAESLNQATDHAVVPQRLRLLRQYRRPTRRNGRPTYDEDQGRSDEGVLEHCNPTITGSVPST
jgi:hypothetical protein